MLTELQKAAIDYTARLVEYHRAKQDQSPDADTLYYKAHNRLHDAHKKLNDLAEHAALFGLQ